LIVHKPFFTINHSYYIFTPMKPAEMLRLKQKRSMGRQLAIVLTLSLLSCRLQAKDVYQIRNLSEQELLKTYSVLLREAYQHADQFWHPASFDAGAGYWGDGVSEGNQGIRAIGEMVFVCGTLLKYSDAFGEPDRAACLTKAIEATRFACATHLSGSQKCPDGKVWGGSWQSAMWAGTLGFGAWLLWDKLDAPVQKEVERVIASEADRFLAGKPPPGVPGDTKAEENGWNLICISLAANMFPEHPHAAAWRQKAIEYMVNTLSAPQDRNDQTLLDGRPVSEWFCGENLFPDFTLENHGFFHPAYVACSSYFMTQAAMHYTLAHRPIPQAATHHLLDVWRMFREIILPPGEPAYPQGMDWELHGIPVINLFASLATCQKDPLAAHWEQTSLQYMRAIQIMENGDLAPPGSRLGFTRHAICAEQAAYGLLAHKLFGPPAKPISAGKAASELCGVRTFDSVGLITHRTKNKFVSFSWKNRIGGMLIPIGQEHDAEPFFTVPILNGLVGSFDLAGSNEKRTTVLEHTWEQTGTGFRTAGVLLLNNGRLKQTLNVVSLGERTVIYQDRVTALTNLSISAEHGVPIGIENDKVTGNSRTIFYDESSSSSASASSSTVVQAFQKSPPPVTLPGHWANVDNRLGIIPVAGSGMIYAPAHGYQPGMAVGADILYASSSSQPKSFKAGAEVAYRIIILFVEVDARKTAQLAKSVSITNRSGAEVVRLRLPEGRTAEVPLLSPFEK
jgi:hypothetical protein